MIPESNYETREDLLYDRAFLFQSAGFIHGAYASNEMRTHSYLVWVWPMECALFRFLSRRFHRAITAFKRMNNARDSGSRNELNECERMWRGILDRQTPGTECYKYFKLSNANYINRTAAELHTCARGASACIYIFRNHSQRQHALGLSTVNLDKNLRILHWNSLLAYVKG